MPHLSKPQAITLALWSFGIALTRSSGVTTVASFIALVRGEKFETVRQRLREWCYDAPDKCGKQRQELEVTSCFVPLLRWLLQGWNPEQARLALALDATHLRQTFTVLAVSVVYRGCSVPVAWAIVPSTEAGTWRPHWEGLLALLRPAIPADWTVIVLADRGLYAKWLYQQIVACGWHPFLRINSQGQFRPYHSPRFRPLRQAAKLDGLTHHWEVVCFKTPSAQLHCTLLAHWRSPHRDPWLIVTDLPPTTAHIAWYGMRAWIEAGFKYTKRGGWHWEQTKMTQPARAERLWLAMAVATLWVVSLEAVGDGAGFALPPPTPRSGLSPFRRGWLLLLAQWVQGALPPRGQFRPLSWLDSFPAPRRC